VYQKVPHGVGEKADQREYRSMTSFPLAAAVGNPGRATKANFGAAMAAGFSHPMVQGNSADPHDPLRQAKFALDSNRPQEAQRIAERILKSDPRRAQALHILGCALLMQDRAADAIAPLQDAARILRDPETDTLFAIALRRIGRNEDALSRLKRATKRRPAFGAAFHEFGYLLFSMERYDEAIKVLSQAHELLPMMPELSILLGNVFLACRNFQSAKVSFARALNISSNSLDAMYGLGMAHWRLCEYQAAADLFRGCLMRNPDDVSTLLGLGNCLLELGQRDAGYDCFRKVARGHSKRYGSALAALVNSGRSRFWLKPSAAARFLRGTKS
jgi:tetratricopeptide (TPR) repeat protein